MIFIDTGAFLARYLKRDPYHDQAMSFWDSLEETNGNSFTSNLVLSETLTLLTHKAGGRFAAERGHAILGSSSIQTLRPEQVDEIQALDYLVKFSDQKLSFTDCVSFVLMRKRKIKRVFSFDPHFERAGFHILP